MSLILGGFDTGWTGYRLSLPVPCWHANVLSWCVYSRMVFHLGRFELDCHRGTYARKGMTAMRMPIFVWAAIATSMISLTATQLIGLSFQLVMFQRLFGMGFFDPPKGGNPILFHICSGSTHTLRFMYSFCQAWA